MKLYMSLWTSSLLVTRLRLFSNTPSAPPVLHGLAISIFLSAVEHTKFSAYFMSSIVVDYGHVVNG